MRADADPLDQLAPSRPMVAGHSALVTHTMLKDGALAAVTLRFAPADAHGVPLLSALASLRD